MSSSRYGHWPQLFTTGKYAGVQVNLLGFCEFFFFFISFVHLLSCPLLVTLSGTGGIGPSTTPAKKAPGETTKQKMTRKHLGFLQPIRCEGYHRTPTLEQTWRGTVPTTLPRYRKKKVIAPTPKFPDPVKGHQGRSFMFPVFFLWIGRSSSCACSWGGVLLYSSHLFDLVSRTLNVSGHLLLCCSSRCLLCRCCIGSYTTRY